MVYHLSFAEVHCVMNPVHQFDMYVYCMHVYYSTTMDLIIVVMSWRWCIRILSSSLHVPVDASQCSSAICLFICYNYRPSEM